ncbi:MAG: FG-GAP repeat domain-containing protein [Candidatus Binatia bacterium]
MGFRPLPLLIGLVAGLGLLPPSPALAGNGTRAPVLRWAERSPLQGARRLVVRKMAEGERASIVLARQRQTPAFQFSFDTPRAGAFAVFQRRGGRLVSRLAHAGWLLDVADANGDGRSEFYYTQSNELRQGWLAAGQFRHRRLVWQGYGFAPPPRQLVFVGRFRQGHVLHSYFLFDPASTLLQLDDAGQFHPSPFKLQSGDGSAVGSRSDILTVNLGAAAEPQLAFLDFITPDGRKGRLRIVEAAPDGLLRSVYAARNLYGPGLGHLDVDGDGQDELLVSNGENLRALRWSAAHGVERARAYRIRPRGSGWRLVTFAVGAVDGPGLPEVVSVWTGPHGAEWIRCHSLDGKDGL